MENKKKNPLATIILSVISVLMDVSDCTDSF